MNVSIRKPLDGRAYLILLVILVLMASALQLRSHFSGRATHARVGWMAASPDTSTLWMSLPDKLLEVGPEGQVIRRVPRAELGLDDVVADMALAGPDELWIRDLPGRFYVCRLASLPCTPRAVAGSEGGWEFSRLAVSPDRRVLALSDNNQGQLLLLTPEGRRLKVARDELNHPNSAVFTPEGLVMADTGNYRVLAWPYREGGGYVPDVGRAARVLFRLGGEGAGDARQRVSSQPYALEWMPDGNWLVLQGPGVLLGGSLVRYSPEGKVMGRVDLPLADPMVMARLGSRRVVLADMSDSRLVSVDYEASQLYQEPLISVRDFGDEALKGELAKVAADGRQYRRLADAGLVLLVLVPLLGGLLLYRLGYDLNARVG